MSTSRMMMASDAMEETMMVAGSLSGWIKIQSEVQWWLISYLSMLWTAPLWHRYERAWLVWWRLHNGLGRCILASSTAISLLWAVRTRFYSPSLCHFSPKCHRVPTFKTTPPDHIKDMLLMTLSNSITSNNLTGLPTLQISTQSSMFGMNWEEESIKLTYLRLWINCANDYSWEWTSLPQYVIKRYFKSTQKLCEASINTHRGHTGHWR